MGPSYSFEYMRGAVVPMNLAPATRSPDYVDRHGRVAVEGKSEELLTCGWIGA